MANQLSRTMSVLPTGYFNQEAGDSLNHKSHERHLKNIKNEEDNIITMPKKKMS